MKEIKLKPKYKIGQIIEHNSLGSKKFAQIIGVNGTAIWRGKEQTQPQTTYGLQGVRHVSQVSISTEPMSSKIEYQLQNGRSVYEESIVRVVAEK